MDSESLMIKGPNDHSLDDSRQIEENKNQS